jgi:hypothetical protein
MNTLLVKRLIVWAVSLASSAVVSALFITLVLPWLGPQNVFPISIEKYGIQYFIWTALPLALVFLVWLDYFLGTKILPE